jgi:hypothetical protein
LKSGIFAFVSSTRAELHQAMRSLRAAPAFALLSIAILGLGIGATSPARAEGPSYRLRLKTQGPLTALLHPPAS